ncbi:GNAT family N-acetyltransferase [Hydrogenophaga sp.]|uniref:GNAT family N-acetyltransferase n=1 Tax=Hydrogenophaga sp. TaxID=1904254 RepID=UPI003F6F3E5F
MAEQVTRGRLREADIESLERATLQAVAPEAVEMFPGWLLPMDGGTVGRAHSAVPLSHVQPEPDALNAIVKRYEVRGFSPVFRLPDVAAFQTMHRALQRQGFTRRQPTLTQTARVDDLLAMPAGLPGELAAAPDAAWLAMYLGEGLDPVDGASRARSLARAAGTLFASWRENGQTLACGAASFGHGWLGVHGMRTAAAHRGRGLAGRLLRTMAEEAQRRGVDRVFLQVDAGNAPALSLYRRLGFVTAWPYAYWRRTQPPGG